MQTTKLKLVLSESPAPEPEPTPDDPSIIVPDTGYSSNSSTDATFNTAALVIAVVLCITIVGVAIYKLWKKKKLSSVNPVLILMGILVGTMSAVVVNNSSAIDDYANIETPGEVTINGEITESTFSYGKVNITMPEATGFGYELYMLANEANIDLSFVPETEGNETIITSIEEEGNLTTNTYGFRLVGDTEDIPTINDTWYPLTALADEFTSYTTNTDANNTTSVYFGILTDDTVTPDTYGFSVDFYATLTSAPTYTLSFNTNGGVGTITDATCNPTIAGGNCTATIPTTEPTRNGYTFLGWADSADAATAAYAAGGTKTIADNTTIYAVWEKNITTLHLSFNLNNGTGTAILDSTCNIDVDNPSCNAIIPASYTEPTRTGYTFRGWADSATATTATYPNDGQQHSVSISADTTLYAVWEKNITTLHLSFNLNGGTSAAIADTTCDIDIDNPTCVANIPSTTPTRDGYTFLGWADSVDAATAAYAAGGTKTIADNTTIYAVWEKVITTIHLSFDLNGGTSAAIADTTCDIDIDNPTCVANIPSTTPTRNGYTFLGWADSATATTATYPNDGQQHSVSISADTTIYAVWAPVYTLSFDANGGTGTVGPVSCHPLATSGDCNVTIPSDEPMFANYTFLGWADASSDTTANSAYDAGSTVALSGNKTIYAIPTTIAALTYMQDFKSLSSDDVASVKNSMTANNQYKLKDIRDNKEYWISKLNDNNVWMTQNLAHDIVGTTGYYTPDNTDIAAAWNPPSTMVTYSSSNTAWSSNGIESYDPNPTNYDLCWEKNTTNTISCDNAGADRHYAIGNYYSWGAAVASSTPSDYNPFIPVEQSICPAGWTLPLAGLDTIDKTFSHLLSSYEMTDDTTNRIINDPLYFTFSGFWMGATFGMSVGANGFFWSNLPNTPDAGGAQAFDLAINNGLASNPVYPHYYSFGFSVRCMVK